MQSQALPAVASNFLTQCSKCETERYHKVLTHPTATSAKLECEVCKKKSTWKLPKAPKPPKPVIFGMVPKKPAKTSYATEYEAIKSQINSDQAVAYNMKTTFKLSQTLKHTKFGVGFVKQVIGDKIEVYFEDEARLLVHGRP